MSINLIQESKSERKRKHGEKDNSAEAKAQRKLERKQARKAETAGLAKSSLAEATLSTADYLKKHCIAFHGTEPNLALNFDSLNINPITRKCLRKYKSPTPIQAATWALSLSGRDIVGIAETGSGKTMAFGLPIVEHIVQSKIKGITVLVIAPTRELAIQTRDTIDEAYPGATLCLYGGESKGLQIKHLETLKPRIIVATPGRLLDLTTEHVDLSQVNFVVLDEADRMFDKGFEYDIKKILALTNPSRQTLMFSATWPSSIRELASQYMKNAARVVVGTEDLIANSRVEQVIDVIGTPQAMEAREYSRIKEKKLLEVLKEHHNSDKQRILIFALYKKEATRIEEALSRKGYKIGSIHGDLSQEQRLRALEAFKSGETLLLVATDVAARGLDIPNVEMVINVTFPLTIEDYVHRIGRTGRGGKSGKSITYFTAFDSARSGELMRLLRDGGYEIPVALQAFPNTIKKKEHSTYGAFYKEIDPDVKPTKIVFDD